MRILKQNILRFFLFPVLYSVPFFSFAQSYISRIYTSVDGLPDSYISSIYQDSKGYLWVGTLTSLCRFDGKEFVNYGTSIGRPEFAGALLLEDHHHRYWISSRNEVYLAIGKQLRKFPISDQKKIEWIFGLKEMKNQKIWLMTDKGAYEFADTAWKKIYLFKDRRDYSCRQVIERSEGMYVNFGHSIGVINNNLDPVIITPVQKYYPYYTWLKEFNDCLYVNTIHGIFKIISKKMIPIFKEQMSGVDSYDFMIDSKKRTWIATEKYGLIVSEPGNETVLNHSVPTLFNLTVILTEDKEGNIWALNYEGLLKVKESSYKIYNKAETSIINNIRHLMINPGGELLASSAGNGLMRFKNERFTPASEFSFGAKFLQNAVIDASAFDDKQNLWLVTRDGKLLLVKKGRIEELNSRLNNEFFLDLAFDHLTNSIYACSRKRIYKGNSEKLDAINVNDPLPSSGFSRLYVSGENLIVLTRNEGVYMIDKHQSVHNLNKTFSFAAPFSNFKFFNAPDGEFWINSADRGLQKFRWNNLNYPERTAELTVKNGLPNNLVAASCFDKKGDLWAATLSGLVVIQKRGGDKTKEYVVNRVDDEDMFKINNWGEAQLVTDRWGAVWLSSFHEIIRFNVDLVTFDNYIPRVEIEKVLLDLVETDWTKWTDSLSGIQQKPVFVKLPHNKNTISILFNAITFSHPNNLIYAYKLEGLNDGWNSSDKNRSVSFTHLPPGSYKFSVKAKKPNTDWSSEENFTFIIKAPFWATWWFQAIIVFGTAAIISLFFRKNLERIKRKSILQQQLQNLELKALKAQMNPHFIYNALNSIQSLIVDSRQTEAIKYIGKFAKLLRQVLEHSDNNLITLEKELSTLELYVQLESLRLNTSLDYQVFYDDQILPEKELIPPLIIQPYVENSLWHGLSRKEGDKKICVSISATEDWLFIRIQDNGIGRKQAAIHKHENSLVIPSKGMTITAQRLTALNQQVSADAVVVVDLYDEKELAQGTEVTLRIKRHTKA